MVRCFFGRRSNVLVALWVYVYRSYHVRNAGGESIIEVCPSSSTARAFESGAVTGYRPFGNDVRHLAQNVLLRGCMYRIDICVGGIVLLSNGTPRFISMAYFTGFVHVMYVGRFFGLVRRQTGPNFQGCRATLIVIRFGTWFTDRVLGLWGEVSRGLRTVGVIVPNVNILLLSKVGITRSGAIGSIL